LSIGQSQSSDSSVVSGNGNSASTSGVANSPAGNQPGRVSPPPNPSHTNGPNQTNTRPSPQIVDGGNQQTIGSQSGSSAACKFSLISSNSVIIYGFLMLSLCLTFTKSYLLMCIIISAFKV